MRALRFDNTGSLDRLTVAQVDRPKPQPGEVLVRVRAAAINPSDVKNVLGKMAMMTVPRTPGRDFAGVVEDGPPEWVGREVFGTGGDLGFRRDGSHVEYLAVPAEAVLVRPDGLAPAAAAGADGWEAAYGVFKAEARDVEARSAPQIVSTDGWKGTQAAGKRLLLQGDGLEQRLEQRECILHDQHGRLLAQRLANGPLRHHFCPNP
jgi:NADPH:quinone reductase-like Zn-dependent oxidoreductase